MTEDSTAKILPFASLDVEVRVRPTMRPTSRGKIIGHHPSMRRVLDTIQRVARSSCTVLVTGESGTGKELVVAALQEKNVDLVCLAGYMRLLSAYFVAAFPGRILNIHPSLLPAFPGLESQRQALEHGSKFTGCTVHFVDENLDAGPIILQAVVPIQDADTEATLSARVLREEHRIYSEAVRIVLAGRYRIEGRRVLISPEKD